MPRRINLAILALSVLVALGLSVSCGEPSEDTPKQAKADPEAMAPDLTNVGNGLGLFVRSPGAKVTQYYEWESEETFNAVARRARNKPGLHIHFAPGDYTIHKRLVLHVIPDAVISGAPGARLVFADGPDVVGRNLDSIEKGAAFITVDHPEAFKAGHRYQAYKPNGKGDRQLEFEVEEIAEGRLKLKSPAKFFPHVVAIGANYQIVEELNFFHVLSCPNLTIRNIEMDGRNRGGIRGHTTYCGIYASGMHHGDARPEVIGLHVQGCTFKNLMGRGLVFYGIAGALIEDNYFEQIRAQAIEIDHISSGIVRNNYVNGAETGVMLNDAFESVVEGNTMIQCGNGVRFLKIYPHDWVNKGNQIRGNRIGPGCRSGIEFSNDGMTDNVVIHNVFIGMTDQARVTNGAHNIIVL